jgi:hypothetical protein
MSQILDSLLSVRCWLGLGMSCDHPGLFLATSADWTHATTNNGQAEELRGDVAFYSRCVTQRVRSKCVKGVYRTALAQKYIRH